MFALVWQGVWLSQCCWGTVDELVVVYGHSRKFQSSGKMVQCLSAAYMTPQTEVIIT